MGLSVPIHVTASFALRSTMCFRFLRSPCRNYAELCGSLIKVKQDHGCAPSNNGILWPCFHSHEYRESKCFNHSVACDALWWASLLENLRMATTFLVKIHTLSNMCFTVSDSVCCRGHSMCVITSPKVWRQEKITVHIVRINVSSVEKTSVPYQTITFSKWAPSIDDGLQYRRVSMKLGNTLA